MSDEQQAQQSAGRPGQWWIKVPAGQFGPVDLSTVQQWVQQRRLTPNDFVYSPDSGSWLPARSVPQLAGYFGTVPPGGPQPLPSGPQPLGSGPPPAVPGPMPMPYRNRPRERKTGMNVGCIIAAVVVGVLGLAILAGMLVPALARAREQARRVSCMSNTKQITLGMKQYAQDYNGAYMWYKGAGAPDDAWCDLGLLYPTYNSGTNCFFCPSADDRPFSFRTGTVPGRSLPYAEFSPHNTRRVISYSYCYDVSKGRPMPWNENAEATVRIFADKKAGIPLTGHATRAAHKDDGRNVAFKDGHVKWQMGTDALDPDPDDDNTGRPYERDFDDWWSDPPWYDE